jgi:hypothetical protein
LFKQFCYGKVDNFNPCQFGEDLWLEGSTPSEDLTWSKFYKIWKQKIAEASNMQQM